MRPRSLTALLAALVLVVPVGPLATPAVATNPVVAAQTAASVPAADRMPGDVPSKRTPWILDGEVTKIVQVGGTMVAGGLFTQVQDPMNGAPHTRQNLVAFDATTGLVSQTFNPTVDGQVQQLLPGPTDDTVYVAGDFNKINGKGPNHLQLLDVDTGLAVPSFKAPSTNGGIQTMELLPGNRLFIGGFFTKVGGVARGQLVTLNATTGAFDPFLDLTVAGHHNNTGSGAQAPIGPREAGLTPAGDRMVVVGNFRTVGGLDRDQIVMLDLTGETATVSTTWATTRYTPVCSPRAFDSYMRDVEMSPDGSFFVVATTGGPHSGTLCDTASRFETYATGTTVAPSWVTSSGGDTLWGVEVTRSAVYVGGHNRWMNNPNGSDRAAQGAVPRPGLSALDPQSGIPLKWNPGRNPRGEAAFEIYETDAGVWVVSDTDWIGNRRYQRPRIAFFPYDEGSHTAAETTGSLPGNVYVGAALSSSNVLHRVNAGGPAVASVDNGPDWAADNTTTSTLRNTGSSSSTLSSLPATSLVGVPASTPLGVWSSERFDPAGGTELMWTFPVPAGTSTQVRLYFASRSTTTRRFSVQIDGATKLTSYDPNVDPGYNKGTMKAFDVTSDGVVNVDLLHVTGNPQINAIEIVSTTTGPNAETAKVMAFDGSTVSSAATVVTPGFDWSNVRNGFMVGRTLFYGQTDGYLYRRSFDGVSFGPGERVNPYLDPKWSTVETGSGAAGSTYAGVLPTWYSQLSSITGIFFARDRVYYTRSGQSSLYWRWFSPDSGIVGGVENTVAGGNITWSGTRGMFLDGSNLYVVSAATGQLLRIDFVDGAPSGTSTVADAAHDWRGRAVFLASVLPNVAPSASFTSTCVGLTCTFDASGSTDTDGTVRSYEWTFSDGEEAGGPTPEKSFAGTGTYDVTLLVTDDGGLTSTTTRQVSVVRPNDLPAASFTMTCEYLECDLDATGSGDPDGTVTDWAWDFGDGTTGRGDVVHHSYATPGAYEVRLTVTDDVGATDDATTGRTVVAAPTASTVSYVGGAATQGNASTPNVTAPTTVSAGDRLLLALSLNSSSRAIGEPTGTTGWTVLGTTTSGSMQTRVYTKIADAGDAGRKVTVPLDAAAKYTATLAVYSGVRPGALVTADLAETVVRADHTTPGVLAPAGSWVVSYWADKSSAATTAWALPGSVTSRQTVCGSSTGRVCSALADSGGSVPTGRYAGLTATADATSGTATSWTVVLRTVEPNQAPTASFTRTCDSAACSFDAGDSFDPDGSVAAYRWDFGDGGTATGRTASHDFLTSGTRDVTLTVTDDEGADGSVVVPVGVVRTNAAPTASFTVECAFLRCSLDASASVDVDGTIAGYAWDFGDGTTDVTTGPTTTHTYAEGGPRTVTLTVTDNDEGTGTDTRTPSVVAARPVAHVGGAVNQGNVSTPNAVVPSGVSAGDRLVMVLSLNNATTTAGLPVSGVTGWTLLDSATAGSMQTIVLTKVAAAGDAGRTTRFAMDAAAKYTLTIAAYSGDMLEPVVAKATETTVRTTHTSPTLDAGDGDWAVSYWADKSSSTTAFALPGSVTSRQATCGSSTGRVCSVLADSGGPLTAGPYGGLDAVADGASGTATTWTILLRQAS